MLSREEHYKDILFNGGIIWSSLRLGNPIVATEVKLIEATDYAKGLELEVKELWEANKELRARIAELEARHVVVPELTANDALHFGMSFKEAGNLGEQAKFLQEWISRTVKPIPADRVLGEGMLSIHPDVVSSIANELLEIGDAAHNASTGPTFPDLLWIIRCMAYDAYTTITDAASEIVQTVHAMDSIRTQAGEVGK